MPPGMRAAELEKRFASYGGYDAKARTASIRTSRRPVRLCRAGDAAVPFSTLRAAI